MKKTFSLLTLAAALAASVSIVGCSGSSSSSDDVIKIGVFEPLTGANGAGGADEYDGIKLANKLSPEVLGKKVQLVVVDNKSDKVEAANAATVLAQKEKVNAVLGSWGSSLSMAGGPIFAEAKIPAVAVSATNPAVTKGNDFYFRVCFLDPFQGTVGAAYAFNELKAKKVAIIREVSNDYSVGLAKFFVDHFVKLSGDEKAIVATADYNTGDQDFSAQLTNIKQFEPDVIFAPGNYTESALIIKQARDLGITAKFIGGDGWDSIQKDYAEAAEGDYFTNHYAADNQDEVVQSFLSAYKDAYNETPNSFAALGYDAAMTMMDAIKNGSSTEKQDIIDQLAKIEVNGVTGSFTFDENGDPKGKEISIIQVSNGELKYVTSENGDKTDNEVIQ